MYEINDRVLMVRKSLKPKRSQTEFGEELGVTRSVIANIEMHRVEQPTEAFMRLLCRTFGVSYAWLKTGVGEMYIGDGTLEHRFEQIMSGENDFIKSVMKKMLTLDDNEWEALRILVDKLKAGP